MDIFRNFDSWRRDQMKKQIALTAILTASLLVNTFAMRGLVDENISEKFYTQEVKGQMEIQIKNRDFFLGLKPWKDGKLVTVDGWGQFSSFEITEKNKIKIKPLVKFPKSYVDPYELETVPDKGIITASFRRNQVYLADINEKRTKELIPFLTFKYHRVRIFLPKTGFSISHLQMVIKIKIGLLFIHCMRIKSFLILRIKKILQYIWLIFSPS